MKQKPKVLLVSMPWGAITEPSLGLGILKSKLIEADIECKVFHANLLLLDYLKASTYSLFSNVYALNDFLFSSTLDSSYTNLQDQRLNEIAERVLNSSYAKKSEFSTVASIRNAALEIRNNIIPKYLDQCLEEIQEYGATMIGFTCMFDQTISSLSLARKIKLSDSNNFIVFGGYALEGETGFEIAKSFPFVNVVSNGEGEDVIVDIAKASINRKKLNEIKNLIINENNVLTKTISKKPPINVDSSPIPNYDDFVNEIDLMSNTYKVDIRWDSLPIETSRGCWWGQIKHCIFCGIDDVTMRYRQRSTESTKKILAELSEKYNRKQFRISDYILPNSYYSTLLPDLETADFEFTCEIKANVKFENFVALKLAGFTEVQPGIESFSTGVLRKIDKGVTAIQNIYCLKLGEHFGININFNIIYGFPNDEINDYQQMLQTIPFLYHLNPPSSIVEVAMTRFAPLHTDPKRFGIKNEIKYHQDYDIIFSEKYLTETLFDLNKFCYYFDRPYENDKELHREYNYLQYQVDYWISIHQVRNVILQFEESEDGITFSDSRYDFDPTYYKFGPSYKKIYSLCNLKIQSLNQIYKDMDNLSRIEIDKIIEDLHEKRIVYREDNKIIGLATMGEKEKKRITNKKWSHPYY